MNSLILSNKQLQILTGKSQKACCLLAKKIRAKMDKDSDIPITVYDFCEYMRVRVEFVRDKLQIS